MHYPLKSLSLATATLLLSLFTPLLPLTFKFEPLILQAQTSEDQNSEALRLNQEGSDASQQYWVSLPPSGRVPQSFGVLEPSLSDE